MLPPSSLHVYARRHDLSVPATADKGLTFLVREIFVYPKYNSSTFEFDIAVWTVRYVAGELPLPATEFLFELLTAWSQPYNYRMGIYG